ncbi:MAG: twin-arginine translocase subunit TatC [Chloroflexota bacterium]|nr:twin-arginine translocase subunit TatC [Chloroflexota bacterium]
MARLRLRRARATATVSPAAIAAPNDGHQLEMSLMEHLDELRKRLTRAMLALVVGVVIAFPLADPALSYLQQPYGDRFQALDPTSPIISYFRVALLLGAILSIPLTTYQVMMFIVPGLTRREKRIVFSALPAITGLFLLGAAFSWFLLIPPALNFLQNFQTDNFVAQWTADGYLGFITALIFWMGVAFETPLIFFILSLMGLIETRVMIHNWRIAIIGSAVAAAFITPTIDPVNLFLVMGPLLTLYVFSIFLVAIGSRINRGRSVAA